MKEDDGWQRLEANVRSDAKENERCWKTKLANEQILFFNSIVTKTSFDGVANKLKHLIWKNFTVHFFTTGVRCTRDLSSTKITCGGPEKTLSTCLKAAAGSEPMPVVPGVFKWSPIRLQSLTLLLISAFGLVTEKQWDKWSLARDVSWPRCCGFCSCNCKFFNENSTSQSRR